jgi:hypothetical protein
MSVFKIVSLLVRALILSGAKLLPEPLVLPLQLGDSRRAQTLAAGSLAPLILAARNSPVGSVLLTGLFKIAHHR